MRKTVALCLSLVAVTAAYSEIKVVEPAPGAVVPLLTDAQKAYVSMDRQTRREKFADSKYRRDEMGLPAETISGAKKPREAYWPKTVRLAWEAKDGVEYRVAVRDMAKDAVVFDGKTSGGELHVDNLEIAASYEWTVEGDGDSGKGTFKTEDMAPRLIRYPGVPNVRDLGGYVGLGGRRAKQGMIIRSAGLNDNAHDTYYTVDELKEMGKLDEIKAAAEAAQKRLDQLLAWQADPKTFDREDAEYKDWCTRHAGEPIAKFLSSRVSRAKASVKKGGNLKVKKGREPGKNRVGGENGAYIRARFGIKSDIDLRSGGECYGMTGSPLGNTVKWFHYPSGSYGGMQGASGKAAFANVFKVFLDERNYPIDFHCIAGQDRTGSVAFILGALLGYDENTLYLDWELTGFWNRGSTFNHKNRFDGLVRGFVKNYPADTIQESVVKYVRDLGFTDDDIAKFRSIMLEDR